jgi:hypothetical protein
MVLEVLPLRDDEGVECLVGAVYRLEERHGSVVRWEPTRHEVAPSRLLFDGPAESVLWRLAFRDGAIEAHDTRHRVLYRVSPDGGLAPAAEREGPHPARAAG